MDSCVPSCTDEYAQKLHKYSEIWFLILSKNVPLVLKYSTTLAAFKTLQN